MHWLTRVECKLTSQTKETKKKEALQLPSVIVDLSLYYYCTTHQALAVLLSLCTECCARTVRSMCMAYAMLYVNLYGPVATLLCAQLRTSFF